MTEIKTDIKTFEKNVDAAIKSTRNAMTEIIKKTAKSLLKWLAVKTPPSIGKTTLKKSQYYRPIIPLKELVSKEGYNGKHATSYDLEAWRNGFKYKIPNTKKGAKSWKVLYAKTAAEAKKLAFIKARGISRIMWGLNSPKIDVETPKEISKLVAKMDSSAVIPALNEIFLRGVGTDKQILSTTNKVKDIQNYASTAKEYAEPYAKKYMDILVKQELKKRKKV